MKRCLCVILTICMLCSISAANVFADDGGRVEIQFCIGSDTLLINGQSVTVETPYVVGAGVTLVPLRVIAEAFGADVGWNGNYSTVFIDYMGKVIVLRIGSPIARVNGVEQNLLEVPQLKNATTMVPLRFISEAFGAQVTYDAKSESVFVVKASAAMPEEPLPYTEPLTMTAFMETTLTNSDIFAEASKRTNVTLYGTIDPDEDGYQEFLCMLLETELPDVLHYRRDVLEEAAIKEGVLVDLRPYITSESIMPNLSGILREQPEILAEMTAEDGAVYVCPKIREPGATQGWFTRADWMQKLGLDNPKTFDEFVYVMDRIRNGDPNENGLQDEVPYFGDIKHLFYFFGLNGNRNWDIDGDNTIYSPYMTEKYKLALVTISDWYKKGYIDSEIFTRLNPRGELWGNNTGAMTFNWFASTMAHNAQLKNVPGLHVVAMDPPSNLYGESAYCHAPGNVLETVGWAISVDNAHLLETLRYFDFWYSEEGSRLMQMGIEGRDHIFAQDGSLQYTEQVKNYEGGAVFYMIDIGRCAIGQYVRQEYLLAGMDEETAECAKHYITDIPLARRVPKYRFSAEEKSVLDANELACLSYMDEYMMQAVLGEINVNETWDAYIAKLQSLGINEVLQVHNSAYARFKTIYEK